MHLTQDLKIKETLTALKWKGKRLNANKGAKIIFNTCKLSNCKLKKRNSAGPSLPDFNLTN